MRSKQSTPPKRHASYRGGQTYLGESYTFPDVSIQSRADERRTHTYSPRCVVISVGRVKYISPIPGPFDRLNYCNSNNSFVRSNRHIYASVNISVTSKNPECHDGTVGTNCCIGKLRKRATVHHIFPGMCQIIH